MTTDNFDDVDLKMRYHDVSLLSRRYTHALINLEKHVNTIWQGWIIKVATRNELLYKIDTLVRKLAKNYNKYVAEPLLDIPPILNSTTVLVNYLENSKIPKPYYFESIHDDIMTFIGENGYTSMNKFLKLFICKDYIELFDKTNIKKFKLYNKIFTPLTIDVKPIVNRNFDFTIEYVPINIDCLIDNTCIITINIGKIQITFEGYITTDSLNVYVRISPVLSHHIYLIKEQTKSIMTENYSHINEEFLEKYYKHVKCSVFFVYTPLQLCEKINNDYTLFNKIRKNNSNLMRDFIQSSIGTMSNTINMLLLGNSENIAVATFLFSILKRKKVGGYLSDVLYNNMSYYLQAKLKKASVRMSNDLERIKRLVPENIPIETKLASMVNIPDNVKSYIMEKNNEIKTGENNYKAQMAINGLLQFPWKPSNVHNEFAEIKTSITASRKYLKLVAQKLDENVYGHEESKKALIELVGKWIQNPESTGQVIGLVGPPGIGKTLLAKSISDSLGIPLSIVGLGGMNDSADLIGHSFTYAGAQYGMIVRQMIKAGSWRSVLFFDEVDKVSRRNETNEIFNTLIHITDPNMNQHFQDRFYSSSVEFDLSGVLIVFSYNDSSKLDPILLDRIKEISIAPYAPYEKVSIAKNYILKELCAAIAFDRSKIFFSEDIIKYVVENYTLEAGVRELRRKLEQILLKMNIDRVFMRGPFKQLIRDTINSDIRDTINSDIRDTINSDIRDTINSGLVISNETTSNEEDICNGTLESYVNNDELENMIDENKLNDIFNMNIDSTVNVTKDIIHKYLGKPVMLVEEIHKENLVGNINGMYATSIGVGGILPIQIYKNQTNDGTGDSTKLKLTGNQKNVMRESVCCALTTAINIVSEKHRLAVKELFPYGFHVHVPGGGTPKDGPSAGCAFTTSFVSIITNKVINRKVSMTGEIELTGKVSKIGGLDMKLTGTKKAGVECVYISEENKEDYEKIYKKNHDLFTGLDIKIIKHIIDIVSDPNVIIGITDSDFDPQYLKYRSKKIDII